MDTLLKFAINKCIAILLFISIFLFRCENNSTNIVGIGDIINSPDECIIMNTKNSGLYNDNIRVITFDKYNNIWIGMFYDGLMKYNEENWTLFNTQNSSLPSNEIKCITFDNSNNIWIGTGNGLAKYDGKSWTIYDTTNSILPYQVISTLAIDRKNTLWIGCGNISNGGMLTIDGNVWKLYTKENSILPSSIINVIYVDNNNNKWIGTGNGLLKIDNDNNWSVYTRENSKLPYCSVDAIESDSVGNIWIGFKAMASLDYDYYHGALMKFDGYDWTDCSPHLNGIFDSTSIVSNRVSKILCDRYGYLWIATQTEWEFPYNLSLYHDGIWINMSDEIKGYPINAFIRDVKIDQNGLIWAATNLGIIVINYAY